jgi:hypothetical protein
MVDYTELDYGGPLEIEYFGACRARGHRGASTNGMFDAPCNECEAEMVDDYDNDGLAAAGNV